MIFSLSSVLALSSFLLPPVLSSPTPSFEHVSLDVRSDLEARYWPQGTISKPENGTKIAPGQAFDFLYNARGDYCLSTFNFTVWLLTSPPSTVLDMVSGGTATGWYFGRFATSTVTNPNPPNPPPSQLTMPDFSKPYGGFSTGLAASDVPMYLAVIEEWNECNPTIGHNMSLAANSIVYNATSS